MRRAEDQIQRAVVAHLKARPSKNLYWTAIPLGGVRSKVEASIMMGLGVRAGAPDLILVMDGKCYALELKAPGGKLSPAQVEAHDELRAAGAEVATAVGLHTAIEQLEGWGLLRGKAA